MNVTLPGRAPDFVGFGVHRSGSTWLDVQLRQHPDIWTPPLKEVHYLDEKYVSAHRRWHDTRIPDLVTMMQETLAGEPSPAALERVRRLAELASSERDDDWYRSVFGLADPEVARVGEITPAYSLIGVEGVEHLARINPDVRVFIVFRDPAERIWSHIKLALKSEIAQDPSILQDREAVAKIGSRKGVVNRTRYRAALESLEKVLAPEQIHVTFFDRVALAPTEMLTELAVHIGVDPAALPLDGIHTPEHTSPPGEAPQWFRSACMEAHRADVEWLAERFDIYPERWLQ